MAIECKKGIIELIDTNIMLIDISNESELSIDNVSELKNVASELAKNMHVYKIINCGEYSLPTSRAREYFTVPDTNSSCTLGTAIIVHNLSQMILVKHTLKIRNSDVPTRIFMDLNKARNWVQALKRKQSA